MTVSELPEFVMALISDIAKSEGFTDYKTEYAPGSNHGDNFLGVLTTVTLSGSRNNNINDTVGEEKLHLLVKLAPSNATRRNEFHSLEVFQRETLMYNKILPLFDDFQREKGLSEKERFTAYPKCYVAVADDEKDELVVIMEDLRPNGFSMWPKQEIVTIDHSYRVVEQLAKYHAVSYALKQQRPEVVEELQTCNDIMNDFFKSGAMATSFRVTIEKIIDSLEDKRHIAIMEELKENLEEIFYDCHGQGVNEPFAVLTHGDPHNNNILYRYEEGTKNVVDVCLVDWQIARWCSPVLDLHYNLLSTTDKAIRDKEYHNLIKHYHKCLSETITKLDSDPDKAITYDELLAQLKRYGKFSALWPPMITQMMMADPDDIPDLDRLSEDMKEGNVDFLKKFSGDKQTAFTLRLRDLIDDIIEYGYWN